MSKTTALHLIVNDMLRLLESGTRKSSRNLDSVRANFIQLQTQLNLVPDDARSDSDTNDLEEILQDCLSSAQEFRRDYGEGADPELDVALRDFQIPFNAYKNSLHAGKTLEEALSDTSWTSGLLNEGKIDPPAPIEFPDESPEDIHKKDISDNLKTYKDIVKQAQKNHQRRLNQIANGAEHPIDTISYRIKLMSLTAKSLIPKDTLEHEENQLGRKQLPINTQEVLTSQSILLNIDDPTSSGTDLSVTTTFLQDDSLNTIDLSFKRERQFNENMSEMMEKSNNPQAADVLKKINSHLNNMRWKPEYLGLNNENVHQLNAYNYVSDKIIGLLSSFQSNELYSSLPINNEENQLYGVYSSGKRIVDMIADIRQGKPGAVPPGDKEFKNFITSITDYLENPYYHVFYTDSSGWMQKQETVGALMDSLDFLAESFPDFSEFINDKKEELFRTNSEKMERIFSELKNDPDDPQYDNDNEANNFEAAIHAADMWHSKGFIDENMALSFQAFDMLCIHSPDKYLDYINDVSESYQDSEFHRNRLKTLLIADHLKQRFEPFKNNINNFNNVRFALHHPGKDLLKMQSDENPSPELFKTYLDKFFKLPKIQDILHSSPDQVKEFLNQPEKDRLKLIENATVSANDLLADVSRTTLNIFAQNQRGVMTVIGDKGITTGNSPEYKRVNRLLADINSKRRNLEDTKPEDYTELFNALADYVNTRSPAPFSDSGKARFAAASEMLMKLGLQLRDKLPDMKADIDMKLKNSIIRSSNFREDFIKICKDPELLEYASAAALKFQRDNNDVKLDTPRKENEFYEKNKNIHEGVAQRLSANSNKFLTDKLKSALAIKDEAKRNAALAEAIAGICMVNWKDKNGQAPTATELKRRMQDTKMMEEFTRQAANFVQQIPLENFKTMTGRDDLPALLTEGVQLVASAPEQKLADKELSPGGIASDGVNSVLTDRSQFFKGELDSKGLFVKIPKRLDLTVDRNALNSLAICAMLRDGYALKDILDPSKLKDEKLKAGKEVLDTYRSNEVSDEDLAKYCARLYATGMEKTMLQVNDTIRSMKDLSPAELIKPQNRYLFTVTPLLQDMAQELGDHTVIRNTCKSIFGEDHFKDLIDKQFGGGEALKQITLGAFYAIRMAEGKLRPLPSANDFFDYQGLLNHYKNDEELAMNALVDYNFRPILNGIAVQNLAEVSRNQQNNSFNFFNTFKSGTDSYNTQRNSDFIVTDYIENDKNGVIRDMQKFINGDKQKNIQELGKALLSGRLITTADVSFTPSNDSAFGKSLTVKNVKARMLMLPHKSAPSKGRTGP